MGDGDYLEGQVEVRKETRRKSVLSEVLKGKTGVLFSKTKMCP